jgi:hypothetical protein
MLDFLVENIYVVFRNHIFQQCVGITEGIKCAPLFVDYFLYSYQA